MPTDKWVIRLVVIGLAVLSIAFATLGFFLIQNGKPGDIFVSGAIGGMAALAALLAHTGSPPEPVIPPAQVRDTATPASVPEPLPIVRTPGA